MILRRRFHAWCVGTGHLLDVLLVASARRVAAVRGKAAMLALRALCHGRVEHVMMVEHAVAGRVARAWLVAPLLLATMVAVDL